MRLLLFLLFVSPVFAFPSLLSLDGFLTNSSGSALNGSYSFVFSLYNVSSGGSALWTESQTIAVSSGKLNALLGSVSALDLPFDQDYYLGVKVSTDSEMSPRYRVASSAYAYTALSIAPNAIAAGNFYVSGNAGIGTDVPVATLEVKGDAANVSFGQPTPRATGLLSSVGSGAFNLSSAYVNDWHKIAGLFVSAQANNNYANYGVLGVGVSNAGSEAVGGSFGANNTGASTAIGVKITNVASNGGSAYAIYDSSGAKSYLSGNVGIGTTAPGNDKLDVRGRAYSSGGWQTTDADYAEWFEKEESTSPGDVIGIDLATGKARKYQTGDRFVGIHSSSPGIVGNRIAETDEEMAKNHTLVALLGQVYFNPSQVSIEGRLVKTKDGKEIGILLSNNKVLIGR